MANRRGFKSPALIGVGAFLVTMLGIVLAYSLLFASRGANPPAIVAGPVATATEPAIVPAVPVPEPEPDPDPYGDLAALEIPQSVLAELPRPVINVILPAGLGTAGPSDLLPLAAVPINEFTPGFNNPGDAEPVLALEDWSDLVVEPIPARWTVVGQQPGWVRVMIPVGRGALPSVDAAAVNHHAVWVPEGAVVLEPENMRVEVSVSNRTLTVFDGDDEVAHFHVGVGIEGVTDTPVGLCSVIARVVIQTGAESLLTNCQSEMLDGFAGADWATVAVHEGSGFNANTGGAVSNGCVRVSPANFKAYLDHLEIGTPVIIVP